MKKLKLVLEFTDVHEKLCTRNDVMHGILDRAVLSKRVNNYLERNGYTMVSILIVEVGSNTPSISLNEALPISAAAEFQCAIRPSSTKSWIVKEFMTLEQLKRRIKICKESFDPKLVVDIGNKVLLPGGIIRDLRADERSTLIEVVDSDPDMSIMSSNWNWSLIS